MHLLVFFSLEVLLASCYSLQLSIIHRTYVLKYIYVHHTPQICTDGAGEMSQLVLTEKQENLRLIARTQ